jgi:ring-1,2-phenylacetyl-CoA epoxidase subunit PaaE
MVAVSTSSTSAGERSARGSFHTLTVAGIERLCDDAAAVTFDVPEKLRSEYDFEAGQSLTLRRVIDGEDHRRDYSICARVGERPRVGVRLIPGGRFSQWLVNELQPGDEVEVQTPRGSFRASPDGGRHLCIAAGSGITPMLSIASTVLTNPRSRLTMLYGNRTAGSVMFAEELADLKNVYGSRFELVHVLSREPRDVELFSGRLEADRLRRLIGALVPIGSVDHVWLCGPFGMIADARSVLEELGVPGERVHFELFYVDEPPPELNRPDAVVTGETSSVTVVLDGRSTTSPMPKDQPVLDSAQTTRADLPFACKGGVCGTCRAHLSTGEVDMRRNYALEDDEVERGFVLTCQSYPVSDEVTVDYDA